jgi:hypothetical protein
MRYWRGLLVAAWALLAAACGDGTLLISFNSGVIAGPPQCGGPGGQFDLREAGGLTVLVVITSNTTIVVAGTGGGTCADLNDGEVVDVHGHDDGNQIVATSITVR